MGWAGAKCKMGFVQKPLWKSYAILNYILSEEAEEKEKEENNEEKKTKKNERKKEKHFGHLGTSGSVL